MATDLNASFNEQYMSINTKLKKRFMRKPNIAEATNEFNALAIQCEHSEQPAFAGHAYIGAAKCEAAAGNFLGEAEYHLAGARQFMKAEMKLSSMKFYSPLRENLEASIGCFMQALNKYPDKSPLRTSIFMELANNLDVLKKKLEAIHYYELSLKNIDNNNSMLRLECLCRLVCLNIEVDRYELALKTANEICDSTINIPENTLIDMQVTRILLALLIEAPEQKKVESLEKLFTDLLDDSDDLPFCIDLKLKLQSIVMSHHSKDLESVLEVSTDTRRLFTVQQQDLLSRLVKSLDNYS